ncbi:MAG: VCBS repeat-containing protein [Chloroflexi bacterium]|nr:VCBS repeat-containing protein [Chloroflexota bacterium]
MRHGRVVWTILLLWLVSSASAGSMIVDAAPRTHAGSKGCPGRSLQNPDVEYADLCCLSGYVLIGGEIIAGAQVALYDEQGQQIGAAVTSYDPQSHDPAAYTFDLSLGTQAQAGDRVTITALYGHRMVSASHVLRPGAQWVNLGVAAWEIDRDGKSDVGIFRPSDATWWVAHSSENRSSAGQFGLPTDTPVPADYDRDGITDSAVFSSGRWRIASSLSGWSVSEFMLGNSGDLPVPADYYGDGRADLAVFQPQTGMWQILRRFDAEIDWRRFGQAGDLPVPADYDGDHVADLAVFRPGTGEWHIAGSVSGASTQQWGQAGDLPVPTDYDGDGKTDLAVFRPGTSHWHILRSSDGASISERFGFSDDRPVPADYDGDGKANIAVFRSSDRTWYILNPHDSSSLTAWVYGLPGDIPLPGAYIPTTTP